VRSLAYVKHAALVVTDSGCVQEEAYVFGVPCVTVRPNTERRATVEAGANVVCGYEREDVVGACVRQLAAPRRAYPPIYGEPGAGERIADALLEHFRDFRTY
jgi:UDP-N-acetylglucosamine 2-epimerase